MVARVGLPPVRDFCGGPKSGLNAPGSGGNFESLHFVVKRTAGNSEAVSGPLNATTLILQDEIYIGVLHLLQSACNAAHRRLPGVNGILELKMLGSQVIVLGNQYGAFQHIAQFANVARPRVLLQRIHGGFVGHHLSPDAVLRQAAEKVLH